jgi:hypothetical protein
MDDVEFQKDSRVKPLNLHLEDDSPVFVQSYERIMSAFDRWNKSVLEKDIDSMHEEDWFLPLSPEERPVS